MIVTASEAVPWTKPADLEYAPGLPLPPLGVRLCYGTPAFPASVPQVGLAFADGITESLDVREISEKTLRTWITRSGNDRSDPN